jgi:hypothetical protein
MSAHARLSPSSRHRWQLCPASVKACEKYSEGKPSPAAVDGTHSHTLLEYCVKRDVDPLTVVGMEMTDHEGSFAVDKERAERVFIAWDYVRTRAALEDGTIIMSETKADPHALTGRDDLGGTVDVILMFPSGVLEIIDYKDGMNPVSAANNPQLEQYAIGVLSHDVASGLPNGFVEVVMTIVQPKLLLKGQDPISTSFLYASDLLTTGVEQLSIEAAATDAEDAPFVPGEVQCKYCAHKGNCTPLVERALEKSGVKFGDLSTQAATVDPATMTDEKLRELVESASLLRSMLDAAEEEAITRISSGHPVEGLKVVRGVGRRQWALPEDEIAARLTKMGVPKGSVWKTAVITPAAVDKLKWEKRDGTIKQLSPKQVEFVKSELVTKSDGKLTVVPESDRREAVDFGDAESKFSAVPDLPSWLS